MGQQQKTVQGNGDGPGTNSKSAKPDMALADKATKAKDLLSRLDEAQAQKKKGGHWVSCCGVRTWIPD